MPTQPFDLRQRQRLRWLPRKHLPEPLLKLFSVDALVHLVGADNAVLADDFAQLRFVELVPRDERKYDTEAPRKAELAATLVFGRVNQERVPLQQISYLLGKLTRLLEGIELVLYPFRSKKFHLRPVDRTDV